MLYISTQYLSNLFCTIIYTFVKEYCARQGVDLSRESNSTPFVMHEKFDFHCLSFWSYYLGTLYFALEPVYCKRNYVTLYLLKLICSVICVSYRPCRKIIIKWIIFLLITYFESNVLSITTTFMCTCCDILLLV
jgi:hypothetical protein